ncbi:MAG: PAS domain-containing sensor histidine kinase [Saprospiraceae bacterium]|nr:PAS domain S-box protein [Saprospiraceae bacterium]
MRSQSFKNRVYLAIWALSFCIFALDLLVPYKYNLAYCYLLVSLLAIFIKEKSDVIFLTTLITALSLLALSFKPHIQSYEEMLLSRVPIIICFWVAAAFLIRFIGYQETTGIQEGRFEALFEYASNGILVANQSGTITMSNPALNKLFGYQEGELTGQKVEELIPHRFSGKHRQYRKGYHEDPKPRSMGQNLNLSGRKKDGSEFPVEVSLSPFKNKDGEFVVAFVIDNTFRKNYEKSILKQKQELANLSNALQELNDSLENKVSERTQELEQAKNDLSIALEKERELGELKSRFVSMASHEFRTPLTSVLSSAGLIRQYADRQDLNNVVKHSERIKNAVNGLNSILTEFLSLGRLEDGRVSVQQEETSMKELVAEVSEGLQNLLKPGQKVEHIHEGQEQVFIDGTITKNILINLISNAIKYSPQGAPITVRSQLFQDKIKISVEDKGIGIPETDQKHMFGRFFRASNAANSTQGTGLGLYIVQRYAEMMGGTIGFESEIEKGSTFWVEFKVGNKENIENGKK